MTGDELEELRRIRPDRVMPDEPVDPDVLGRTKARLMAEISSEERGAAPTTPSLYPRLAYRDEMAALEFLVRAFGFTERREARMEHASGTLAWLEIGDGLVMIGRAGPDHHDLSSPAGLGGTTTMINVYVTDVDEHHRRATAAGARVVMPPEDMFWGERRYEALDPEGHRWHFAQRLDGSR